MPQDLKAKYGYKQYYSKAEVDSAIKRKKIGNSRGVVITANCYAYAMYCSPEEFKKIHDSAGKNFDYSSMRSDVSDILFNGASDFSFSTIVYVSSISDSTSSGGFGSGGASSGFDGGDSGGGGE